MYSGQAGLSRHSRFPGESLAARGGSCSVLLSNNPAAGVARGLFWQFTIDFAEIAYGGGCQPSMTIDWVPFRPPTWRQLVGRSAAGRYGQDGMEASFYTFEHDDAGSFRVDVVDRRGAEFLVRMTMTVDFYGIGEAGPYLLEVQAEAWLPFSGLTVQLLPPPRDLADARRTASEFISMAELLPVEEPGKRQGHRWRFAPDIQPRS